MIYLLFRAILTFLKVGDENTRTGICIFEARNIRNYHENSPLSFFALLLSGCKDHTKPVEKKPSDFEEPLLNSEEFLRSYVKNPSLNDRMCEDDIERAKKDLKKYKNIYVTTSCFGCKTPPYADERIEYATKNHFKVINNDYSCVVIDGQTQGCYKALVDLKM